MTATDDLVIAPTTDQIRALVQALPETEYYVDADAALDAQKRQSQFNVVDFATGWKVDLIVRKSRPFSRLEFDRRELVELQGMTLAIATAEDVIIAKLEWAKLGQSDRQIDDAAGVLQIRGSELDVGYIERWVKELRLEQQWDAARAAAASIE